MFFNLDPGELISPSPLEARDRLRSEQKQSFFVQVLQLSANSNEIDGSFAPQTISWLSQLSGGANNNHREPSRLSALNSQPQLAASTAVET